MWLRRCNWRERDTPFVLLGNHPPQEPPPPRLIVNPEAKEYGLIDEVVVQKKR
jgi:hypothetical protein